MTVTANSGNGSTLVVPPSPLKWNLDEPFTTRIPRNFPDPSNCRRYDRPVRPCWPNHPLQGKVPLSAPRCYLLREVQGGGREEIKSKQGIDNTCHRCIVATMAAKRARTVTLPIHTCLRCGHEWIPRKQELPKACSKCKSAYWNVPRKKKRAS
jgi:predicted Zn-ribbon and HTH transcriptional regulator